MAGPTIMARIRLVGAALVLIALAGCASVPQGAFIMPVEGMVTSPYGWRGGRQHHGIDIAAKRGTLVHASQAGRVVFRGRKRGFGRLVILDHGRGMQTYYAHLSGFKTREGRRVKRGQAIGKVGSSGRASGPHLHFEVRINGASVDPRGIVPLR